MNPLFRRFLAAAALSLVLVLSLSAQTATPTAAPDHFSDVISSAKASGKAVTFDFIVPLVTGERVWTLPDDNAKREISAIGADYVCFSEPWNAGSRERCTAFTNIASITFQK